MRYITARNVFVRVNRHLDAHCLGQKLRKARRQSAGTAGTYYLENADGSIAENIDLETLARRIGCLKNTERIGVPLKRTQKETDALLDELAKEIAASKVMKKAIARDVAEFTRVARRQDN